MLKIFSFLLFLYIKIDHEIQPFTAKEHLSWILLRSLSTWRKNELFTKDYLNLEWIFVTFECCCFCLKQKQKQSNNKKHYLKLKIFYIISLLKEHLLGEILITDNWSDVERTENWNSGQKVLYCKVSSFCSMTGFPAFCQCQKHSCVIVWFGCQINNWSNINCFFSIK